MKLKEAISAKKFLGWTKFAHPTF